MTHAPVTGTINLHHFSGTGFWCIHVSCKSGTWFIWYGTKFWRRLEHYSKPESGVHVAEMMAMIIVYIFISCNCK